MAVIQDEAHSPRAEPSPDVEEDMSIGRYFATRIPTLVPPMNKAPNPFQALMLLNRQQWLFFWVWPLQGIQVALGVC
jgi:SHS family lactate transporter-like MFS transporter